MDLLSWLILILIVLLGTVGQLSLKYAFNMPTTKVAKNLIIQLLLSHYFWIWFICYVAVTILWLLILRTIPLSQAFPALGLNFVLIPLASYYFLHEDVVFSQWMGITIIIAGVVLVVQK
jgi:undecaprenyl phosphate-alpha-L-ara4N flippase subunit ArnE